MEREEICIKYSVGKPERKRPLGRTRLRWEDITKVLKETAWFRMRKSEGPRQIGKLNELAPSFDRPSEIKFIIIIIIIIIIILYTIKLELNESNLIMRVTKTST
jgi:hypothetical protein